MNNLFQETDLDRLQDLHKKRLDEIATKGDVFTNQNTDKSYRGIFDHNKNEAIFPPDTAVNPGTTLETKHGNYYVASMSSHIGLKMAKLLPITGSIEVMSCKSGGYIKAGTQIVLGNSGNEITVPAFGSPAVGSAIKLFGEFQRVVSVRRDGPVNVLKIAQIQAPTLPATRHVDSRNFVNATHMSTQKAYGMFSY